MGALAVVFSVCIVATYVPALDKDLASPLWMMAVGIAIFILDRALFVPMYTMGGFTDGSSHGDRVRATCTLTMPQYLIYLLLLVYLVRLAMRARTHRMAAVAGKNA